MNEFNLDWIIERVRQSRERTSARFPLPSVEDSLDYAITEVAETIDAFLRQKRMDDKRNRDKNIDPRSEFGQAGYMIASAAIQIPPPNSNVYDLSSLMEGKHDVYTVLTLLVKARAQHCEQPDAMCMAIVVVALHRWCCACLGYGWKPEMLINQTCNKFEEKWV